ncbi:MAG TPA: DUF885 domain-containing protein [Xanthomonadales bacterium]|nr:DUF885 domain-containing protein [Xanthomonadales bacterium]
MHTISRLFLTLLLIPALAWGVENGDSEKFREIYEREWAFRLDEFPTLGSWVGDEQYDDRLGHVSVADQERRKAYWQGIRKELNDISCDRLSAGDCVNYQIYRKQIDDFITGVETRSYLLPFNSDSGFYMGWVRLPDSTDFSDEADYSNYLSRIGMIPVIMDEYIGLMREGIEIGFTQPRVVLEGRDKPIQAQLVDSPEDSPFFAPFTERPDTINEDEWTILRNEALKVVEEGVVPAYQALFDFYHEEYLPGSRELLGALQLPGGEAFYQGQIRYYATVDLSPREIHEIGLREVERITAEMQMVMDEVGFEGNRQDFIDWMRSNPEFYAKTPRELLAEASYHAKKIDGRLPMLFSRLPRQPYGVAPVPEELAPFYTAGRYVGAPLEAHRGGYYWVNTYQLESRPLYALPALTLHEGTPGHHLQNALAKENDEQPPFRRFDYISAYGEGWGLYSEKLGVEMDIYETPYEDFGRLTYEMWRACRLVIDTGVHAFGWSREQAREYLSSRTALSIHEVNTEIDRYISWPAQALSYKLGEIRIWELRREAEEALGADFDIRAFHDAILALGSVPLGVLSKEIERWVATQQAGEDT